MKFVLSVSLMLALLACKEEKTKLYNARCFDDQNKIFYAYDSVEKINDKCFVYRNQSICITGSCFYDEVKYDN